MKILTGQAAQQYRASGQPFLPANQNSLGAPSLTSDASNIGSYSNYQLGTRLRQFGQSPIEQLLLGVTKPFRGIASQAVQLGQGVGDIIGQLGQGKSLNDALANTNISDRSGMFMSEDEQQMAKENPLLMGAQNIAGLAAYGVGGPSTTLTGALGKGALSGALGGFSAANKVEEMPETMLAGAGMGALISGGMYGIGKANQGMKSNRLKQQGNLALSDMTDEQVDNFFTSNDILKNSDIFPDQYQVEAKNTLKSMIDKNNRLVTALDDDVLSKLDDGSLFGNSNMTLSELKNKYSNAMPGFAGDVEDKIGTRVTADDFQAYEQVRQSGATNMWDIRNVEELSGLDRNKIKDIMENYGKYKNQFGIEKFNIPDNSALNEVEDARNMALQYRKMGGNEEMIKRYETDMINSFKQLDSTSREKILSNLNDELDNLPSKVDYSGDYIEPDILDYQYRLLEKEHRNLINSSIPKSRVVPVDKITPADVEDKIGTRVTADDFQAYEQVRQSGATNMWDIRNVEELSGLDRNKIKDIMENYGKYKNQFGIEKFNIPDNSALNEVEDARNMALQYRKMGGNEEMIKRYETDMINSFKQLDSTSREKILSNLNDELDNLPSKVDYSGDYIEPDILDYQYRLLEKEHRNLINSSIPKSRVVPVDKITPADVEDKISKYNKVSNAKKYALSTMEWDGQGYDSQLSDNMTFEDAIKWYEKIKKKGEPVQFLEVGKNGELIENPKEFLNYRNGLKAPQYGPGTTTGGKTPADEGIQAAKKDYIELNRDNPKLVQGKNMEFENYMSSLKAFNKNSKDFDNFRTGLMRTPTDGTNVKSYLNKAEIKRAMDSAQAYQLAKQPYMHEDEMRKFLQDRGYFSKSMEGVDSMVQQIKSEYAKDLVPAMSKIRGTIAGKGANKYSFFKEEYVLESLNPTGTVFTEYTPEIRANAKLGKNMTTLDKTMGKSPNETITIYRGVPSSKYKNINAGDFITTNKQLAKDYAGTGIVLEKKVKLSDILDDKTNPLGEEYIYRPNTKVLGTNIVKASSNPYNAKFEAITKTYKGKKLQTKLKEFLKTLPTDDPIAKSIRNVSKNLFNV